jgi:hypothetical protein
MIVNNILVVRMARLAAKSDAAAGQKKASRHRLA